jgi:putative ABC transport system permease protein
MHFLPILNTLRRHRTAALLIIFEIALTCAIVSNAVFLISERLSAMNRSSGVAEDELVRIRVAGVGKTADATAITAQDFAALRAIPGVKSVVSMNMVPFGGSSWNTSISTIPDDPDRPINVGMYMASPGAIDTLGVRLISGRDFTLEEYADYQAVREDKQKISSVIITKGIAERLFPGQNAVGKPLYVWGKEPATVVGIIDHIARPNNFANEKTRPDYAMFLPIGADFTLGNNYMLRVDPARSRDIIAAAGPALMKVDPSRVMLQEQCQTFGDLRADYFKADRAMAWLLGGVCIALLIITALGVVGLASFWVQQRTRQIGIRRALGATKTDILRYFQTENFILATLGILLGMGIAYGINLLLMSKYSVPRLPAGYLPIGAALLWLLGQIAVLGPALRASMIPPAIATRSV